MNQKNERVPLLDEIYLKIGFSKIHATITIIFGFLQCFDAVELILLSFLGPILTCKWQISQLESSFITMSVFIGMIIGSLSLGKFSDKFGRKKTILISACGIYYFSLLCAFSPTVLWVILNRTFIGYFIGGITIMISTYVTEMMPISHRGVSQMCVQFFWSLGSYYISLLTITLVPVLGWRLWLIISVCPMILLIPMVTWLPESPRYLLMINRKSEAINIINKIAEMNGKELITNVRNVEHKPPSIKDLFHSNYVKTTIISTYICFVIGISYYGFVLSSSIINHIPHKCLQNMSRISELAIYTNSSIDNSCCFILTWDTMKTVFISISGELISYSLSIVIIKFLKRKLYLQLLMFVIASVFFLMNLCLSPINMGFLMMFGRGSAITMMGVQYLYISEVFPTTVRCFGIGLGSSFLRIGAILSSLIVNIIIVKFSFFATTIFFSTLNIIGIILVFFLPFETRDRSLLQSIEEEIEERELLNISNK